MKILSVSMTKVNLVLYLPLNELGYDEFEDIKGVVRIRKSKQDGQWPKEKRSKGETTIYKALHRTLKIKQHEPHLNPGVKSGAPEG